MTLPEMGICGLSRSDMVKSGGLAAAHLLKEEGSAAATNLEGSE